jgi:alpha-1,2-mannosyltransferase
MGLLVDRVLPYLDPRFDRAQDVRASSWPETHRRWSLSFVWQLTMLTVSGVVLVLSIHGLKFQDDFNGDLYLAGVRILHGISPYDVSLLHRESAAFAAGGQFHPVTSPRWPAPVLLLAVPFALLPIKLAGILFMLLSLASVIAGLRLLGVRDSRCLLVALVAAPTVNGVLLGNISPLIFLGAALAWRVRHRHLTTIGITALVAVAKLYLWPMGIWLLVARGRRSLVVCAIAAVLAVLVGWMAIGFAGLAAYPSILIDIARIGEPRGCSLVAFLIYLGFGVGPARFIAFAAAFALLFVSWKLARRGYERQAFGLVMLAALTATPVVWGHYMVLLFVPIALLSPTISWLWFLPTLAAFAPDGASHSYGMWILPMLAGELVLATVLCEPLIPEPMLRYWRSIVTIARAAAPS